MEGAPGIERVGGGAPGSRSFYLENGAPVRRGLGPDEIAAALRTDRGRLWVDIDSDDDAAWSLLAEPFGFHPLAIEDTRSPECRIKLETYDGYLFLVVRGMRLATWTPDPYDVEAPNLYLFLGERFLVTVHAGSSPAVEAVVERIERDPEPMLRRGVEHIAHAVVDRLVDFYFPLLDEFDSFVDALEDEVFEGGEEIVPRIFAMRRTERGLRRNLAPMREVMAAIANRPTPYLAEETRFFFRDVYDHVIRQLEFVDMQRERLTGLVEIHLSSMSNQVNAVMKTLSIVATLVLPATLVASVYGMNFRHMPGLANPFGFWLALGGMAAISGGFLAYVWWKGWI